jgi:hypothetical protein
MNYSLTIPAKIAEKVPEDMTFECALTEDGIVFRPVKQEDDVNLPSWAQNGHAEPEKAKRRGKSAKVRT